MMMDLRGTATEAKARILAVEIRDLGA